MQSFELEIMEMIQVTFDYDIMKTYFLEVWPFFGSIEQYGKYLLCKYRILSHTHHVLNDVPITFIIILFSIFHDRYIILYFYSHLRTPLFNVDLTFRLVLPPKGSNRPIIHGLFSCTSAFSMKRRELKRISLVQSHGRDGIIGLSLINWLSEMQLNGHVKRDIWTNLQR